MTRAPLRPHKENVANKKKQLRVLQQLSEFKPKHDADVGRGVFGEMEAHRRRRGSFGVVPIGPRFQAVLPAFGSGDPSADRGDQLLYRPPPDDFASPFGSAQATADASCAVQ